MGLLGGHYLYHVDDVLVAPFVNGAKSVREGR